MDNKKKLFISLGLLLCLLFGRAFLYYWYHTNFQKTFFSNVIIFGDSQSDIGNGPENLTIYDQSSASSPHYAANIYVPISNPVNTEKDIILPKLPIKFPPMNGVQDERFTLTLPNKLPLCHQDHCYRKAFRSLNWSEYFIYNAVEQNIVHSPADFRPWVIQYHRADDPSIHQSVNYAWYAAMSTGQCHRFDYTVCPCTMDHLTLSDSVYHAQNKYRYHQTTDNMAKNMELRHALIIPSTQKQIQMFKNDLVHHKVIVNNRTLYIVWTGANDIAAAFTKMQKKQISKSNFFQTLTRDIPTTIAGKNNHSIVQQLLSIGAKHIIIVGQYNLDLVPGILTEYKTKTQRLKAVKAMMRISHAYNAALYQIIKTSYSPVLVQFVDIETPINELIFKKHMFFSYLQTLGESCINHTNQNKFMEGDAVSCFTGDVNFPIGWWNDFHLSTQLNQVIAHAILTALHRTALENNTVTSYITD
jgi:hypothetical protein